MNSFHLTAGAASCAAREVGEGALIIAGHSVYVLVDDVLRLTDFTLFQEAVLR